MCAMSTQGNMPHVVHLCFAMGPRLDKGIIMIGVVTPGISHRRSPDVAAWRGRQPCKTSASLMWYSVVASLGDRQKKKTTGVVKLVVMSKF